MNQSEAGKLGAIASKKTNNRLKLERIEAYNSAPKLCRNCDKPISYEKRINDYCNHSCCASFNNPLIVKTIAHGCSNKNCTSEIKGPNKFCDSCINKKLHTRLVQNNSSFEDAKTDGTRRRFLLRTCPHQYEICKETQWQGQPIPLVMDHIDGNSTNNIRSNFRLICPNCDALLPTYKIKNKGKGRAKRRQRYKDGKSF